MSTAGRAEEAGVVFGPTPSGKTYLSRNDHRSFSTDGRRNRWSAICPPANEFGVFAEADVHNWSDSRPHLWGVQPGLAVMGSGNERIAMFRTSGSSNLPWHGYPVSALDNKREFDHRPEPELVDRWLQAELITEPQAARIKRGKV